MTRGRRRTTRRRRRGIRRRGRRGRLARARRGERVRGLAHLGRVRAHGRRGGARVARGAVRRGVESSPPTLGAVCVSAHESLTFFTEARRAPTSERRATMSRSTPRRRPSYKRAWHVAHVARLDKMAANSVRDHAARLSPRAPRDAPRVALRASARRRRDGRRSRKTLATSDRAPRPVPEPATDVDVPTLLPSSGPMLRSQEDRRRGGPLQGGQGSHQVQRCVPLAREHPRHLRSRAGTFH